MIKHPRHTICLPYSTLVCYNVSWNTKKIHTAVANMNVQRAPDKSNERRKAHKRWEQGQMAKEEPGHSLNMQGYVGRVKDHLELNLQGM